MDKRHDPKQLSAKLTDPLSTKTIFSNNNSSNLKIKTAATNNTSNIDTTSKLNTGPLDDAMQELLDICKQYNDKLTDNLNKNGDMEDLIFNHQQDSSLTKSLTKSNDNCRLFKTTECDNENKKIKSNPTNVLNQQQTETSNSIENLQQKQCDIQAQLDEVLQVSKKLASKQRKKLDYIIEDSDYRNKTSDSGNDEDDEDEEDELVEFQQIENELRISELNRQLNNIQEELRLRLFRRLLSNTHRTSAHKVEQGHRNNVKLRYHGEQASPSSSSCSNEPSVSTTTSGNLNQQAQQVDVVDGLGSDKMKSTNNSHKAHNENKPSNKSIEPQGESRELPERGKIKGFSPASNSITNTLTNIQSDLDSTVDNIPDYEALTPTTSRDSLGSSKRSPPIEPTNVYNSICDNNAKSSSYAATINYINPSNSASHSSTFRNNSANSDLERIEEDEEDSQDYYNNSDHFRSVYEEKLSPIYNMENSVANGKFANSRHNNSKAFNQQNHLTTAAYGVYSYGQQQKQEKQHITCSREQHNDNMRSYSGGEKSSFRNFYGDVDRVGVSVPKAGYSSNVGACSRPLTLYLPKPDEQIDLVEHIQALGHDVDIISDDLSLNSTSAQGYLWKSCSNNNKKWLRRYFHFDRNSKLLLYYDSKSQLSKKQNSPKNMIQFDEISDVYVDHKLSGIGEKDRSSKRKNYVFVLATIHRKYLLASSRAEVMRAWIDILYTAAKANDYFQHLTDIEDETIEEICP